MAKLLGEELVEEEGMLNEGFVLWPLALLEQLNDDPSPFVRKSVANYLNDISKDHP